MSRAHPQRSAGRRTSSSSGKGVSIKTLPGWYGGPARWPSANTARCTRRSAGIRRMWPSHWCLAVLDRYTRWPVIQLADAHTTTCTKARTFHWIARFSVLIELASDRGSQYYSLQKCGQLHGRYSSSSDN